MTFKKLIHIVAVMFSFVTNQHTTTNRNVNKSNV